MFFKRIYISWKVHDSVTNRQWAVGLHWDASWHRPCFPNHLERSRVPAQHQIFDNNMPGGSSDDLGGVVSARRRPSAIQRDVLSQNHELFQDISSLKKHVPI